MRWGRRAFKAKRIKKRDEVKASSLCMFWRGCLAARGRAALSLKGVGGFVSLRYSRNRSFSLAVYTYFCLRRSTRCAGPRRMRWAYIAPPTSLWTPIPPVNAARNKDVIVPKYRLRCTPCDAVAILFRASTAGESMRGLVDQTSFCRGALLRPERKRSSHRKLLLHIVFSLANAVRHVWWL